jgi:Holliday junction DNA helicase RuvA
MIGKLTGKVDSYFEDHIILDVSGVGYLVYCSQKIISSVVIGQEISLIIHTHVREDLIHLYGFASPIEKQYFNALQIVNGIGAKLALLILSQISFDMIYNAVQQKNKDIFKQISGVGPKLAERMIIELKDKLPYILTTSNNQSSSNLNYTSDAIAALVNLGISRSEAQNLVSSVLQNHPELETSDLITFALRNRQR